MPLICLLSAQMLFILLHLLTLFRTQDGKKVLWRDIYAEIIPKKSIMPPLFGKPKKSKTKVILDQGTSQDWLILLETM